MKFAPLLLSSGWCCPWRFFHENRKVRSGLLAAKLGVADSTVRQWRRFYARGQISCDRAHNCPRRVRPLA